MVSQSRDSAGYNPVLVTVDISCSRVSHICSLVLLVDEFSGFVKFRKRFRDFSRLIADMWLYSWCFVSAACLDLSVRLATVRLMSGGAMPASRCWLSMLVGFMQPIIMRHQSYRTGLSLSACVDLVRTAHARTITTGTAAGS